MGTYKFLMKDGSIRVTHNIKKFGEERGVKELDWTRLNTLKFRYFDKDSFEFLKKFGLEPTEFNICCFQLLGCVHLYDGQIEKLKAGGFIE